MNWRLFLFTIYFLAGSKCLLAQPEVPNTFNQEFMHTTRSKLEYLQGTPFLDDEFKNGDIYFGGKYKIEQIPLRLNLYNDQLEYKSEDGIMAFGNPDRIDKVVIGNEVFIFLPKSPLYKISGFVRLGNLNFPSIITKMTVDFFKREDPKPFDLAEPKLDRLERAADRYYLMKSKHEIKKVSSVKKLIKYLGKYNSELTDFSRKEEFSANDEEELVKLLDYYHELDQVQ